MPTLLDCVLWRIDHDPVRRIVHMTRRRNAYESVENAVTGFERIIAAIEAVPKRTHGALVDMRGAPTFPDTNRLRDGTGAARMTLLLGWAGVALLVRSPSGKREMNRVSREDGLHYVAFLDQSAALQFLDERIAATEPHMDES